MSELKKGRWRRALQLSRVGARFALGQGRRLVSPDPIAAHRALAEMLVAELGQLKGLPMKVGQILSYMDGVVPDAYREVYQDVLGELRTHSPQMDDGAWREVFVQDMGQTPEEMFDTFDIDPIAAASIGQVHRATHEGIEVCVKIQYPGIAEATASDMQNLDAVIGLMRRISPSIDTRQMIEDFRVRLVEECDYEQEARYQKRFADIYANDRDITVPAVLPTLCGRRVLTTRWSAGESLDVFMAQSSPAERDRMGQALFRFAFGTLIKHGLFHADPHPGNLLFRVDEHERLGVLDYGCVQPIDDDARRDIRALLSAALEGGDLRQPTLTALGVTEIDDLTATAMTEIVSLMLAPILSPQPYRFSREFATTIGRAVVDAKAKLATRFLTRRGRFVAQREGVMFIVRNLFGLASIWGTLNAKGDFRQLTAELIDST